MANNNRASSYTKFSSFNVKGRDGNLGDEIMMVEGFARDLKIRTAQTQNGVKKVADLSISAVLPDKTVARLFGEDMVNTDFHNLYMKVSFWDRVADSLEQYPPQKGQKVIMMVRNTQKREYDKRDGGKGFSIEATGIGFPYTSSPRKQDGVYLNPGQTQAVQSASNQNTYTAGGYEESFSEIDAGDDDLPF